MPHPTLPATPTPVLSGVGGSVRNSSGGPVTTSGEGRMSAGEVRASAGVEARTKMDVHKDDIVEARIGADAQFEDQDADAGFEPHEKTQQTPTTDHIKTIRSTTRPLQRAHTPPCPYRCGRVWRGLIVQMLVMWM